MVCLVFRFLSVFLEFSLRFLSCEFNRNTVLAVSAGFTSHTPIFIFEFLSPRFMRISASLPSDCSEIWEVIQLLPYFKKSKVIYNSAIEKSTPVIALSILHFSMSSVHRVGLFHFIPSPNVFFVQFLHKNPTYFVE